MKKAEIAAKMSGREVPAIIGSDMAGEMARYRQSVRAGESQRRKDGAGLSRAHFCSAGGIKSGANGRKSQSHCAALRRSRRRWKGSEATYGVVPQPRPDRGKHGDVQNKKDEVGDSADDDDGRGEEGLDFGVDGIHCGRRRKVVRLNGDGTASSSVVEARREPYRSHSRRSE